MKNLQKKSIMILIFLFILTNGFAGGDDFSKSHSSGVQIAGLAFTPPAGWKSTAVKNGIQIESPDELVFISVTALDTEAKNAQAVLNFAKTELNKHFKITKESKPKNGSVNGIQYVSIDGEGALQGTPLTWDVSILFVDKPVMVLFLSLQGGEKHTQTLQQFAKSFQRVGK